MGEQTPPIEVLRAARQWATEHRHQQPDDRMLAIVYAAGVAAGRTAAAAAIRAEAAQLEERDGVAISYAYGFADAADFIDPPATRIAEDADR